MYEPLPEKSLMRLFILTLMTAFLLGPVISSQTALAFSPSEKNRLFKEGMKHFKEKNYTDARNSLLVIANDGFGPAQYNLGILYARGLGGRKNIVEAYKWLKLSIDSGQLKAKGALSKIREKMTQEDLANAIKAYDSWKMAHP